MTNDLFYMSRYIYLHVINAPRAQPPARILYIDRLPFILYYLTSDELLRHTDLSDDGIFLLFFYVTHAVINIFFPARHPSRLIRYICKICARDSLFLISLRYNKWSYVMQKYVLYFEEECIVDVAIG